MHMDYMNFIDLFSENINEARRLIEIHTQLIGGKPGYPAEVEVLNKSGVVLLVACWEAFVEDMAKSSFECLLSNAQDHTVFPAKVLTQASKDIWNTKDERTVWTLADSGWKNLLSMHKDKILKEYIAGFHTPRPDRVDNLFESLIGLKNLSSSWKWRGMNSNQARRKLDDLITLRGSIAHRVKASKSVRKDDVKGSSDFVVRLAYYSSNTLRDYIYNRVGEYPWPSGVLGRSDRYRY